MRIQAFAIGLALAWAAIGGARAAEALFTITGGDQTATFTLPLNPTPDFPGAPVFFGFLSVPAFVGGSPVTLADLEFFSADSSKGGFIAGELFTFRGPQFYTDSEDSPSFKLGVYTGLTNLVTGKTDTVTVTDPLPMTVPELPTWAMLLLGFVGLSYAGYRKARTSTRLVA